MRFSPIGIAGAYLLESEPVGDERGTFARIFCREEFGRQGLATGLAQCSVSYNRLRGTLRGLHYQAAPNLEAKLVRCAAGRLYDVVADVRPGSPTFRRWVGIELTPRNQRMLYIPEGCAHGFQTLADDTEVLYLISEPYSAEHARGIRWDDPAVGVRWPLQVTVISERDRTYPDLAL